MARFVNARVPEVVRPFWAALRRGEFIADAALAAGGYRKQGMRWVAACGGVRPRRGRNLRGRCLSFAGREEIALAGAPGDDARGRAAAGPVAVDTSRASCGATPTVMRMRQRASDRAACRCECRVTYGEARVALGPRRAQQEGDAERDRRERVAEVVNEIGEQGDTACGEVDRCLARRGRGKHA